MRAGRGAGVPLAEPVTLDTAKATLTRTRRGGRAQKIAAGDWAFANCRAQAFPGTPDPTSLCVRGGFDPAFAYDLHYTGRSPPVLGIGFAAVRDLVDFLRHDTGSAAAPNPVAGQVKYTVMTGVSQAGNFVRSFIHLGFNLARGERIVFDGANPHIAARLVPLNVRFGVPGGAAEPFEPGSEGVLWWGQHEDGARKRGGSSLLARCQLTRSCPKIVETAGLSGVLGPASVAGLRRRGCGGRHPVAVERTSLLLPVDDARWRSRRLQRNGACRACRLRAPRQPQSADAQPARDHRCARRLGGERQGAAGEPLSDARAGRSRRAHAQAHSASARSRACRARRQDQRLSVAGLRRRLPCRGSLRRDDDAAAAHRAHREDAGAACGCRRQRDRRRAVGAAARSARYVSRAGTNRPSGITGGKAADSTGHSSRSRRPPPNAPRPAIRGCRCRSVMAITRGSCVA